MKGKGESTSDTYTLNIMYVIITYIHSIPITSPAKVNHSDKLTPKIRNRVHNIISITLNRLKTYKQRSQYDRLLRNMP